MHQRRTNILLVTSPEPTSSPLEIEVASTSTLLEAVVENTSPPSSSSFGSESEDTSFPSPSPDTLTTSFFTFTVTPTTPFPTPSRTFTTSTIMSFSFIFHTSSATTSFHSHFSATISNIPNSSSNPGSSSVSPISSKSHIGAIIGGTIGGVVLITTVIILVLIHRSKKRRHRQRSMSETLDHGIGGATPFPLKDQLTTITNSDPNSHSNLTPVVPPEMTTLGESNSVVATQLTASTFGTRRNLFVHQDGGRIEMPLQAEPEDVVLEEIPPPYESLI
ncbi:uncharacterized protein C8R40DRAFT_1172944 [Lentinula edodes]|uniref:uncharacterized protein n=1 Tax=Lentinula edodes TaxID=5353 RepID=UPI001E8D2AD4|nr:uncharacterized protein C8R40DRAFT_1172944 [Lentinula edodes]KAH7872888.1 hypothetical protein C8R40DRAFT_1172944 [Lentinula edodes]